MQTPARARITFIAASPDLFGAYLSYLRDDGYTVSVVADVREAATQGETDCPDLVFLDLGPSSLAGLAMLRELKADACLGAIPLVMLASFDSLDDIRAGLKLGGCDYIIKTETTPSALARRVPNWARLAKQLPAARLRSRVPQAARPRPRPPVARPRPALAS